MVWWVKETHRHSSSAFPPTITPPLNIHLRALCAAWLQDAFGNYVVQYVLELGQVEASQAVIATLSGHFAELSLQKFSSNVVEKCLKLGGVVRGGVAAVGQQGHQAMREQTDTHACTIYPCIYNPAGPCLHEGPVHTQSTCAMSGWVPTFGPPRGYWIEFSCTPLVRQSVFHCVRARFPPSLESASWPTGWGGIPY